LPGEDNRGKWLALALAADGFHDQIFILTEEGWFSTVFMRRKRTASKTL
jgi:hypothetical protein